MIFARYKGAAKNGFTTGKTYIAKPEVDDQAAVGFGFIEVVDDHGATVRVDPEKDQFEYVDEVYVVAVRPFEDVVAGDVLVADDADGDRAKLNVKGMGYRAASDLAVLDGTNVFPGVVLCDLSTGEWVKVSRVDEALWVVLDGSSTKRSPEEFRFAVSEVDGEVMTEPLATCVDESDDYMLTKGRRYYLVFSLVGGVLVLVKNDCGELAAYFRARFRMG